MKTPLQELLERVQEYREADTSPLVVSRLNSVCVDILGMLEKEKDVMCEFAERYLDSIPKEHPSVEDVYNETFNTNQENLPDSTNGYTYYPQENKTVFNTKEK